MSWDGWALAETETITAADRRRTIRDLDGGGRVVGTAGGEVIS